jgi:hypothetical protein
MPRIAEPFQEVSKGKDVVLSKLLGGFPIFFSWALYVQGSGDWLVVPVWIVANALQLGPMCFIRLGWCLVLCPLELQLLYQQ